MSVLGAKKVATIAQADDPRRAILEAVGDIDNEEVFGDLVLVGTFIQNEKTKGGVIVERTEDEWQSKVGLILKKGPLAWSDWEADKGANAKIGTWVAFHIKDGWPIQINDTPCRLIPYERIRMRISDPNLVF